MILENITKIIKTHIVFEMNTFLGKKVFGNVFTIPTSFCRRHGHVRHCYTQATCSCPPLFYANDMLVSATVLRERHARVRHCFTQTTSHMPLWF